MLAGAAGQQLQDSAQRTWLRPRARGPGVVGSLDYKIISAENADDLFLPGSKATTIPTSGDQSTLDFYIQKKWLFVTMKIDPKQMKTRPDGTYEGPDHADAFLLSRAIESSTR